MTTATNYNGIEYEMTSTEVKAGFVDVWSGFTGAYVHVTNVKKYMKGKRTTKHATLDAKFFPCKCSVCGNVIEKTDAHRAELQAKTFKVWVAHYACAWSSLLNHVYGKLYDAMVK